MLGLTNAEVREKQRQFGANQLPEQASESPLSIFLRQFRSPFIYVLLAAALVSFSLQQNINGAFILVVLVLNASIGSLQEFSAQKAAAALQLMVPQYSQVLRDGSAQQVDARELVPGDWVLLASGDKVPADLKIAESASLQIDESILTGESLPSHKQSTQEVAANAPLGEQTNTAFAGTLVSHGRGCGTVIAIGESTQLGRIASGIRRPKALKPPLLQRIERFTLIISYSVLTVIALIFCITLLRGADLADVFLLGVALAVSAIPEGLPAAITVALAIGMRRMAKHHVIIRKLIAVESLGSCTYIASDKTGTLTVNELTITQLLLPNGQRYSVSGEGLNTDGAITPQAASSQQSQRALEQLILCGLLANEASITPRLNADAIAESAPHRLHANGDGVDLAFLVLAVKSGLDLQATQRQYPEHQRIAYESENAYSAHSHLIDQRTHLCVKGSVEKLLPMCHRAATIELFDPAAILAQVDALARQGFRVLALAGGHVGAADQNLEQKLQQLTFLGLAAMIDPLRAEAKQAIEDCRKAQISVAMITGDHPQTALAIARELEISDAQSSVVTGADITQAASEGKVAMAQLVESTRVFARIEPTQKQMIIEQLIHNGEYVAVTGDGVNDAPALRHAHVGIAMGKRGTDVARESSDLIITDDNFSSIVRGIEQGRIVYSNIRKVVFLLISTGAAEITLFILSVLFALPIPLFPIQLLWLNLVTNGIQDIALAFEPAEGNELQKAPRAPSEALFNRLMLERVLINAMVMGCLAFAVFSWQLQLGHNETYARNITLLLMVLFENVHIFNSRSETQSIFRQAFFGNPLLLFGMLCAQGIHIGAMYTPYLREALQLQTVTLSQWSGLLSIALLLILVDEVHKYFCHRNRAL